MYWAAQRYKDNLSQTWNISSRRKKEETDGVFEKIERKEIIYM